MNVASLELCKELHELSKWETSLHWYANYDDTTITFISEIDGANGVYICSAYDLGYLLRKFAGKGGIELRYGDKDCIASSHMWSIEANTPEDVTCKLAIELFKQGILKRE